MILKSTSLGKIWITLESTLSQYQPHGLRSPSWYWSFGWYRVWYWFCHVLFPMLQAPFKENNWYILNKFCRGIKEWKFITPFVPKGYWFKVNTFRIDDLKCNHIIVSLLLNNYLTGDCVQRFNEKLNFYTSLDGVLFQMKFQIVECISNYTTYFISYTEKGILF